MNNYVLQAASILAMTTFGSAAFAECTYPTRAEIPNGLTVEKEQMLEAQQTVKQYVADMEAYLDCLVLEEKEARTEMDDLPAEEEQQREDMLNKKYNAAVEEMENVAAAFNAEVQAFREREE